ncbi:hypothetical protein GWO13_11225 [Candidatus Bathyarchaeota archaeon]|nr:hypothetical protein [Candidatus Bathyarchaeota archaeon]
MLNKKAQIRMLEAFLAVLVIFSASIISIRFSPPTNFDDEKTLSTLGMQALIELDSNGTLGKLIDERNWTAITGDLKILLPVGVSFNVTVYDDVSHQINDFTIGNGLKGQKVVSVEYPCASQSSECCFYLVRLQLAFVG